MRPSRREAFRFWLKLGFISFGGPAGQIAIMHREVVERHRWLDERTFMQALNFCMLLPGPEALQLAIWIGWRLHGVAGAIVAGLCFIVPAVLLLLGLSFAYALYGELPAAASLLAGLQATVVALILHALIRIGRRALARPMHWLIALAALATIALDLAPFPAVIMAAAAAGALVRHESAPPVVAEPGAFPWRVLAVGLVLWLLPTLLILATAGPRSLYAQVYGFFTTAALVTFGGAYAVLAWVNQQVVEVYGWLTQAETVVGLALAETTPGPLIIVLQFVGFMAGWHAPGGIPQATAATATALLASWATFLPAFILILVGAPYVERLAGQLRLGGALAGITAAVVGVIASLALVFGRAVFVPAGIEEPRWPAIMIAALALVLLERTRVDVLWIIACGALAGLIAGTAWGATVLIFPG
ncbi:MAG: chromate efflux transporter [Steroidobacteraceae bacterium]